MNRSAAMLILMAATLSTGSAFAQTTSNEESGRAERLAFLQELAVEYQLLVDGDRVVKMSPHPVYRWSHPVGTTADGISFVWMDGEQPVAIGSMLILRDGTLYGEFQSLTTGRLKAVRKGVTLWEPAKPGGEFLRVPDAPKPADSATERLTQMKSLARRFHAELTKRPPEYSEGSIWPLRLLPKQLVRYGGAKGTLDGAIFAFCHDTDPEILLTLEARGEKNDVAWYFAFGPLTSWKATGHCDKQIVWSQPPLASRNAVKEPYITFIPTTNAKLPEVLK